MTDTTHRAREGRHETLEHRRAGRSGLDLPAFSFGLWQKFGADYPYATQREILLHAFDLGISHFDNADRYGPPFRAAQQTLGRVLATDLAAHRDEIVVSTKAGGQLGPSPHQSGGSRKALLTSLEQSLRDLRVDHVDVFYHHTPDPTTPLEETAGALADAVRHGKALYVAVSNYSTEQAREIAGLLRGAGTPLLVNQVPYSIFNRSAEEDGLLDLAAAEGFGIVAYSPLAQGLLTDKYLETIPDDARARRSAFLSPDAIDDGYRRRVAALNRLAQERGQSLAQLALQWVLRRSHVTSALIGASAPWQLDHNVAAAGFPPLTEAELALVDEHSRATEAEAGAR